MPKIIVKTLGQFSLTYQGKSVSESGRRSKKMWTLLKYMVNFREREISQNEIIELLWSDNKSVNHANAFKTQLHRLRVLLSELSLPPEKDFITNSMGICRINRTLDIAFDTDEFEKLYNIGTQSEISEKERLAALLAAFELYEGDYIHTLAGEKWVVPKNTYFHSLYLRIVYDIMEIFSYHKRHNELINICRKSLQIDNLDEKIHINLIKSLINTNDRQAAKRHFRYVLDLFYNQIGTEPSSELLGIYEDMARWGESVQADIFAVKRKLSYVSESVEGKQSGAFFCELEFFKHIYRLQIREAERTKTPFNICLISVKFDGKGNRDIRIISSTMQLLFNCLSSSLRSSDVFARYSLTQFVVLLPSANNSSELVLNRLLKRFKESNPRLRADIEYKFSIAELIE